MANPERGWEKTAPIWQRIARHFPDEADAASQQAKQPLVKPRWIRQRLSTEGANRAAAVRTLLRAEKLHTVCEEATCPNQHECFGKGQATFMILGDLCTRRCPFCDVAHGQPLAPDPEEPERLARAVAALCLRHVVITSVNRDDLPDGGAAQFVAAIERIRSQSPSTRIEVLVPDFRGRLERALELFAKALPDVFNHNLETIPRLYPLVRPGADYAHSLRLLAAFKERYPQLMTKSGLMVGLGETDEELYHVMRDLRAAGVEMLTIGQYLAPSRHHYPVRRYVEPERFRHYEAIAHALGFRCAACAPLVRSSYMAEEQAASLS